MNQKRLFPDEIQLDQVNQIGEGCMISHLGIEVIEIGDDYMIAKMPVDERTKQPMGLLHGGANAVLSETLGSYASTFIVDINKLAVVGLEINANHIRSAKSGFVYGKVTPIHIGKKTHVWNTEVTREDGKLISVSRLTVAIIEHK